MAHIHLHLPNGCPLCKLEERRGLLAVAKEQPKPMPPVKIEPTTNKKPEQTIKDIIKAVANGR